MIVVSEVFEGDGMCVGWERGGGAVSTCLPSVTGGSMMFSYHYCIVMVLLRPFCISSWTGVVMVMDWQDWTVDPAKRDSGRRKFVGNMTSGACGMQVA